MNMKINEHNNKSKIPKQKCILNESTISQGSHQLTFPNETKLVHSTEDI